MRIQCKTRKGGSVRLNESHGVWASYAVAGVADLPIPELFYGGARLPNGRQVQFFLNRDTGLVVVDIIGPGDKSGREVLRMNANAVAIPAAT